MPMPCSQQLLKPFLQPISPHGAKPHSNIPQWLMEAIEVKDLLRSNVLHQTLWIFSPDKKTELYQPPSWILVRKWVKYQPPPRIWHYTVSFRPTLPWLRRSHIYIQECFIFLYLSLGPVLCGHDLVYTLLSPLHTTQTYRNFATYNSSKVCEREAGGGMYEAQPPYRALFSP